MKVNSINGLLGFNNTDLFKLADEIDTLELKYKETIINYGNALDKDNVITDIVLQETPQDLKSICDEVILNSQQIVDSGSSVYVTNTGLVTEDSSNTEVIVGGAIEDNLSAGTRAWVDGHYIVGSGVDNNAYYNKGFVDGLANTSQNANVKYIYHSHASQCSCGGYGELRGYGFTVPNALWVGVFCNKCNFRLDYACRSEDWSYADGNWHDLVSMTQTEAAQKYKCYNIVCGKTTSTIESALIEFN